MTFKDKANVFLWAATVLALILFGLVLVPGCTAAKETAKKDWQLTRDFTACDAEAKAIARSAPSCLAAISQLLELMQQAECKDFPSSGLDGGITIGGVSYVCHE